MILHKYYCMYCSKSFKFEAPTATECGELWQEHWDTHKEEIKKRQAEELRDSRRNILTG